jgi:hypothetical protein
MTRLACGWTVISSRMRILPDGYPKQSVPEQAGAKTVLLDRRSVTTEIVVNGECAEDRANPALSSTGIVL